MQEIPWIGALLLTGLAAVWDWRTRRIPNWLTVTGVVTGFGLSTGLGGWAGAKGSLLGMFAVLLLLLPLVLLRGLGAGDWKLMGSLGTFLGLNLTLLVLFGTILIAGLMATIQVTWRRRWRETAGNLRELMMGVWLFRLRPHPTIRLENPGLLKLPFGVAAALAAAGCYFLRLALAVF